MSAMPRPADLPLEPAPLDPPAAAAPAPLRVAYIMSRFPKLTETFILFEMSAVERQGVDIWLFPLLHEREATMHPEAAPYVARATYLPFLSLPILASQWAFLRRSPRRYFGAIRTMIAGTWRSPNFLIGGLGIFPKVVHAAGLMERDGVRHVHCHFATHPALAGLLIHRLTGITYSFTAHGSDLHVDRTMLCQKVAEAAFAVTISNDNRAVFERECGAPSRPWRSSTAGSTPTRSTPFHASPIRAGRWRSCRSGPSTRSRARRISSRPAAGWRSTTWPSPAGWSATGPSRRPRAPDRAAGLAEAGSSSWVSASATR